MSQTTSSLYSDNRYKEMSYSEIRTILKKSIGDRGPGAGRGAQDLLERQGLITIPSSESIMVAPTPDFYRWSFASMWTPGPFECKPTRAYYYLTDVDPSWAAERQHEYLRDYNFPTLWSIWIIGCFRDISSTISIFGGSRQGAEVHRCSRRRRSSKGGRITASK